MDFPLVVVSLGLVYSIGYHFVSINHNGLMQSKLAMRSRIRWYLLIGVVAIMLAGCASPAPLSSIPMEAHPPDDNGEVPADDATAQVQPERLPEIPTTIVEDPAPIEDLIRSEVLQWQGTPYRIGGSNRNGIDCSGFVQRLYRDLFDRQIPRSTALQSRAGQWIGKEQLRTGDLVFFNVSNRGRHVGIYLGAMEFAHASIARGVTISSLEEVYWRQSYWTARRYLNATY